MKLYKQLRKGEVKNKKETERYTHLNAQFQRIARRDKKAFSKEQRKETEEDNRKDKMRDLCTKTGNIKGTFHPKIGTIKGRNGKGLIGAEEIKKRWKEYTEELYKKDFNDPDNHNGVISHPELDILEYEVKWALGSTAANKASGGDRIPAELLTILKIMLFKCYI